MLNAMTVDVEEYFMVSAFSDVIDYDDWHNHESRVESSIGLILDMLDEADVKATFFILGWIAERRPALVREIHGRGHEVASHGYSHRLVYEQTPEEFREDVRKGKRAVEDAAGTRVLGYRAPSYSITKKTFWAIDVLADEGFVYDSSVFPIYHDRYGYPEFGRFARVVGDRGGLLEIPLSTIRILGRNIPVAGGGYLRLFPLRFINWSIRRLNTIEKEPAVMYIHPWELDPGQPRIRGRALSNFRHNINLAGTAGKLKSLLHSFRFAPVSEVYSGLLDSTGL